MNKPFLLGSCLAISCLSISMLIWHRKHQTESFITQVQQQIEFLPADVLSNRPFLMAINQLPGPHQGQLVRLPLPAKSQQAPSYFPQAPSDVTPATAALTQRTLLPITCNRVHYADHIGGCLQQVAAATHSYTVLHIFNQQGEIIKTLGALGRPDRLRVSANGDYLGYTSFVKGHAYTGEGGFSTHTRLIDLTTYRAQSLEDFQVYNQGNLFYAAEFNFWGITFVPQQPDIFYVSLGYLEKRYLLKGNLNSKRLDVILDYGECPSISPDGMQLAFKVQNKSKHSHANKTGKLPFWSIAVMDLASKDVRVLDTQQSIDDQIFWLSNQEIAYSVQTWDQAHQHSRWDIWKRQLNQHHAHLWVPWANSPAAIIE